MGDYNTWNKISQVDRPVSKARNVAIPGTFDILLLRFRLYVQTLGRTCIL